MQYLKPTTTHGVTHKATGDECLQVFDDAEFAREPNDKRSISGLAVMFGVAVVY